MSDVVLLTCNETELLKIAREQGLGILKQGLPKELLISFVTGEVEPGPEHKADVEYTRAKLEIFIADNWGRVRSQLPGCNGKCRTYPCSDTRHMQCFTPNKDNIQ